MKKLYKMIAEELDDVPTKDIPLDGDFAKDFIKENRDMGYEEIMKVVSAYTAYYCDRVFAQIDGNVI